MRKWIGIICVLLGAICIISSVGFVAYNRWEDKHAEEIAQDLLDDVQNIIDEFPTEQTVPDDTETAPTEMATVKVDGYDCIGILLHLGRRGLLQRRDANAFIGLRLDDCSSRGGSNAWRWRIGLLRCLGGCNRLCWELVHRLILRCG